MQANKHFLKRADIILIICVSIICVALFIPSFINKSSSPIAVVFKDGEEINRIKLSDVSSSYSIDLECKPSAILQVEHGKIRYKSAECHDKLCVNCGWLSKPGDTAACLPSKTLVVIEGSPDKNEPDIISY